MFDYQLKKSKRRKTVAIKIYNQTVTVYAPHYVPLKQIDSWLLEKQHWIETQLKKQLNVIDTKQYPIEQNKIKIFSESVELIFREGPSSDVKEHNNALFITHSSRVKNYKNKYEGLIKRYLEEKLAAYVEMRIAFYCEKMEEALPKKLTLAVYKRRWGSCNSKRELSFNLHLIGAPHRIIDYVIVHELAHLRYLNHSKQFWDRVEIFYPDYKAASNWLKTNGMSLLWVF